MTGDPRVLDEILFYGPDALIASNVAGGIEYLNAAGEDLFGWLRKDLVGQPIFTLIPATMNRHPTSSTDIKEIYDIRRCAPLDLVQCKRKDGTTFIGEATSSSTEWGKILAIRDATEAEGSRRDLEELAEMMNVFARNTDLGLFYREGAIPLFMSPRFLQLLGFSPNPPYPSLDAVRSQIHRDDWHMAAEMIAAADRGEPSTSHEMRAFDADGIEHWIRASNHPVRTSKGVYRSVSVFVDITDQKKAEAALEIALLDAKSANEAKTDFLARMSHELRTPLNAVLGFGQLLAMSSLSEEQTDAVIQILASGEHLLGLIDEVLDISRLEQGAMRLSLEPINVNEVLAEAIKMLQTLALQRDVHFEIDELPEPVHVRADRQRLKQVVVNLLSNAIKYNHDHGVVKCNFDFPDENRFRLTITDSGIGIHEGVLNRLFQPFERLAAEHSHIEGTGLGLALTRRLMDVMGGEVGVTSQYGEGSTFWIDLPREEAPIEELAVETLNEIPELTFVPSRPMKVLYVEDYLSNVRLLEQILALRPFVILETTTHGKDAIKKTYLDDFDLIFLDLNLPDISGEEVLLQIRSNERTRDTPIVVVSADAAAYQSQRLVALGADRYITKPFDIPRLLSLVDQIALLMDTKSKLSPVSHSEKTRTTILENLRSAKKSSISASDFDLFVHDLSNFLSVISLTTSMLKKEASEPQMKEHLELSGSAASEALELSHRFK
jgi:PAS domain S-box-containing protein